MSSSEEQGPPPEPPAATEEPAAPAVPTKDDRTMAMLCHLLAIVLGFIGPLIIWLIKKEDSPFVDDQGKEALNFQLTILIAVAVSFALMFVCIGFILLPAVGILDLVFCIIAGLKANNGEAYRYPMNIRFIK
jgi:uncharacterized Tic20 family protein